MAIPKQVQDQSDKADKMFEEENVIEGQSVDLKQAAPVDEKKEEPDFKHQYEVQQGMLKAQSEQLRQAIQELERANTRNESLQEVLESIGKKEQSELSKERPSFDFDELSEDEFNEYDEPILKLVKRQNAMSKLAKNLFEENQSLKTKINGLDEGISHVKQGAARIAEDSFKGRLLSVHEDFDAINEDPKFAEWLNRPVDSYTGITRKQIAEDAWGKQNANLINKMVADFKTETQGSQQSQPKSKLESQVVPQPGLQAGDRASVPKNFKPVSREEYSKASEAVIKGKMSNEDFIKLEKDFYQSVAAGLA